MSSKYLIQRLDSLESIAAKELGSAQRWPEIVVLNRIRSPYPLFIGQPLLLSKEPLPYQKHNINVDTDQQKSATMALARSFVFIFVDTLPAVGSRDKLVRKVLVEAAPAADIIIGVMLTVKDVTGATLQSIQRKSFKPIGAEVLRQSDGLLYLPEQKSVLR